MHAETSTGSWQPVEEISALAHQHGALMVLDAVTSLACMPVEIDEWQIDACLQLHAERAQRAAGACSLTLSERAMAAVRGRKTKCRSWYLDVGLIAQYWGAERVYHHTAPITMNYALYEALRIVVEEGLEARWQRHQQNAAALQAGLSAIGLEFAAQEGHRLPQLNAVKVPAGVDEAADQGRAAGSPINMEIGAGLGPFKGKVWRIGLMGESSRRENVVLVLNALEQLLKAAGVEIVRGRALAAADAVYAG